MKIVFFGSGAFGLPSLASLASTHHLLAVVSQPDRPAGRGSRLTPTPISEWTQAHQPDVPLLRPESVNKHDIASMVRAFDADAWVVIAFGQKLSTPLLNGRFAINLHASLLPRWRGAAPINAAMLAGDALTGNSVITLADRMDAGLILGQSRRPIEPDQTAGELHDLLAADGPALLEDVLAEHASGTLRPQMQNESDVTLAPKLRREDAWIDFNLPACAARQRIHGLTPWPGVALLVADQQIKVLRVRDHASLAPQGARPGTLFDRDRGLIAAGEQSALELITVQPANRTAMSWHQFVAGRRELLVGSLVTSVISPPHLA